MNAQTEIALIPTKENALQVFSAEQGLEPYLQQIRAEIDDFVPDISSRKGREAIASIAHKVARSKTALDNIGKDLVAELKEIPKKIDAERKRMRDLLDLWKDEVRRPLSEWEEAEAARVAKHERAIALLRHTDTDGMNATLIGSLIKDLEGVEIGADCEEFEAEAHRVKATSLATLRAALTDRAQYEAEQAELARLRAEKDARDRQDAIDREAREIIERETARLQQQAQAERDAAAQRERDASLAAERRELELKLQAECAEREKVEANQRAEQAARDSVRRAEEAAAAERQRQADEQARIQAEAEAREADRSHKSAVLKAAKEAVMTAGLSEEQANAVVKLIAAGGVPRIYVAY